MKTDGDTSIQELKDLVSKFVAERHWQRHHTPKNLVMNMSVEVAELMEHYVWERSTAKDRDAIKDELADVFFNVLTFANSENIDLTDAFLYKFEKLQKKYPAEKFNAQSDDLDEVRRIKKAYRAKKDKDQP